MGKRVMPVLKSIASCIYHRNDEEGFYWDVASDDDLDALIDHLSNTQDDERKSIRQILAKEQPRSLLDVGCGPATELSGYKQEGLSFKYTGMDRSARMLRRAKYLHPDAQFVFGEIEDLPFENNSFDAVLLKHVLEHLRTYERAVQESLRVAERFVLIDFFHHLDSPLEITLKTPGYWNNWYSRKRFESFVASLPVREMYRADAVGTAGQKAELYLLYKG